MRNNLGWLAFFVAAIALAATFRFAGIDKRPMHADEAVHAFKLDELTARGTYAYDPKDYHGPTLYYATLPVLWATGARSVERFTETQLRLVPLVFGVALIPLLWLLRDAMGRVAMVTSAALLALSPAMVFFSTYYIQEMLLVWFTLAAVAAGWRYRVGKRAAWAIACGVCTGLAAGTKETWILSAAAAALAWAATLVLCRGRGRTAPPAVSPDAPPLPLDYAPRTMLPAWARHRGVVLSLAALAGLLVWAAVMSVGFTRPQGILDGFHAYGAYATRAESAVEHHHPWHYYLQLITWWRPAPGPLWSEGLIVPLAVLGMVAAATGYGVKPERRAPAVFAAVFTLSLISAYAAVAYKTPWCLLSFLLGLIVLAGIGVSAAVRLLSRSKVAVAVLATLLGAAAVNLGVQAYWVSMKLPTDRRNPYVYAGTLRGAEELGEYIDALAKVKPDLSVAYDVEHPWPLPWYLRHVNAAYATTVRADVLDVGIERAGPGDPRPSEEDGYVEIYGIRPDLRVRVWTKRELFAAFQEMRARQQPQAPHEKRKR